MWSALTNQLVTKKCSHYFGPEGVLDIGEGKVEELITYNQLLDHLEQADEQDNSMDQELYKFRAIIGHEGPLKALQLERQ